MSEAGKLVSSTAMRRLFFGPDGLRAGWRLAMFIAMVEALMYGADFGVAKLLPHIDGTTAYLVREVLHLIIFLLASAIMGRIEKRTLADYGLPWRAMFGARFWQGAGLGFASISALALTMTAAGFFHFDGVALRGLDILKWGGVWALVFLLVGVFEEFRARGYGLVTLAQGIGFWPAAVISSAYFGYSHHGNSGEDWIGLFNAGAIGMLFCLMVRRTGSLWLAIGFHTAFDWGETYFYGAANSGDVLPGHLLNTHVAGTAWLSGGTVGPEGSVLGTLLLALVWIACAAWLPKPPTQRGSPDFRWPFAEARPV